MKAAQREMREELGIAPAAQQGEPAELVRTARRLPALAPRLPRADRHPIRP